jgi:hypothetical protein
MVEAVIFVQVAMVEAVFVARAAMSVVLVFVPADNQKATGVVVAAVLGGTSSETTPAFPCTGLVVD